MPVLASEIKLFQSTNRLGGLITPTQLVSNILNNLFDTVSATESRDGSVEYRCFYVKNTNLDTTLENARIEIVSNTPNTGTSIGFGIDVAIVGATAQTIVVEGAAPIGVSFQEAIGNSKSLGDLPPNSFRAVWLRRAVVAGAVASANDPITLRVTGDTTA